jgi:GTPase
METLYGHTQGLSSAQSKALRALYKRRVPPESFLSPQLARGLTEVSALLNRRVGVLVDRRGRVQKVVVGDAHRVFLPELGARRAGARRFRGVRLVLSTLNPEGLTEDDLTDLSLLQLDAVMTVFVEPGGLPGPIQYAHLLPPESDEARPWRVERVERVHGWDDDWLAFISDLESQFARSPHLRKIADRDAVILVGVTLGDKAGAHRRMEELGRLADTAQLQVVDTVIQNRQKIDGRFCIGKGKLQDLVVRSMHLGAEALIFDRELSPSQLRNVATNTDMKVLDRTQLILDIFAQHATTREGKLQVELAQLRYRMPRLAIMPTAMSRLTGGIGGRGPGETKLEINKRRAQERLTKLERDLKNLGKHRARGRARRKKLRLPVCSIVGYTNAGKSTLLNRMTCSDVLVQDQLFATLDPTSRRLRFPEEREIILTDTVGFIQDLPKTLIRAFKATLEELDEADLLLHVVDSSDPLVERNMAAVDTILRQLELGERRQLLVWNKADAIDADLLRRHLDGHGGLAVSALEGQGMTGLLERVERELFRSTLDAGKPPPQPTVATNV